jgi:hypothetical protein
MDEAVAKFVATHSTGAMITVRANGSSHVARVTIGLVDGRVISTAQGSRVRVKHVRANPRVTYFVFDTKSRLWVGLEGRAITHEGPAAYQLCLDVRKATGTAPDDDAAYLKQMEDEQRVAFELQVERSYGALE